MRRRPEGSLIFLAPGLWLAVILLCLASSACFRYARIETGSSTTLEARIDRSDSETIFVTSSEGKEQTISRSEVVDIDHPGKARLTTGVLMVAGGAAMLIYGLVHQPCGGGDTCDYSSKVMPFVYAVPLLGVGGILAASGGLTYYKSVTAARPPAIAPSAHAMRQSLPRLTCSFCAH